MMVSPNPKPKPKPKPSPSPSPSPSPNPHPHPHPGEHAIVVKVWLHRTAAAHGLEFEEWRPTAEDLDPDASPAEMIVNSSELRGVCSVGSKSCPHQSVYRFTLHPDRGPSPGGWSLCIIRTHHTVPTKFTTTPPNKPSESAVTGRPETRAVPRDSTHTRGPQGNSTINGTDVGAPPTPGHNTRTVYGHHSTHWNSYVDAMWLSLSQQAHEQAGAWLHIPPPLR